MQVTDLKAILDYEHNEQWLAALNCYKGIWDHNPTDDVAIRYCFFCWYLIWQWEQIDFPGEDISFEAKITVDNRMGISKAELEHTLSSIACGYSNNFQIEYKCILVHLKICRFIDYYRTLAFEELVHIEVGLRVNGISQKLGDKDYHE